MIELATSDFAEIRPLAEAGDGCGSFVAALLEGNHAGRVFVDDRDAPSTALVSLACEFLYPLGAVGDAGAIRALEELIRAQLVPHHGYVFVFPTSEAWTAVVGTMFADALERHDAARDEYVFDHDRFLAAHGNWRETIPTGIEVRAYDRALAEGQGFPEFWGSLDAFLARGFGFAAMKDGEPVSRCHTVLVGAGKAEISIHTEEAYRRRGMATLVTCAFIDHALALGLQPAWSNWHVNAASRSLAEHMGFVLHGRTPALIAKLQ